MKFHIDMGEATWEYKYQDYTIKVQNEPTIVKVFVNGKPFMHKKGIFPPSVQTGTLPTGEHIKVRVAGVFEISCELSINDILQQPIRIIHPND